MVLSKFWGCISFIIYLMTATVLENMNFIKYLGIPFGKKLNFTQHVQTICSMIIEFFVCLYKSNRESSVENFRFIASKKV